MATNHRFLLSLTILLGLLAISATARPCKTLLFFFTSTSYYSIDPTDPKQNPTAFSIDENPIPSRLINRPNQPTALSIEENLIPSRLINRPRSLTFLVTEVRDFRRPQPHHFRSSYIPSVVDLTEVHPQRPQIPFEFYTSVKNSIRDRAKDIMRIVGALLFGVGCGALTAATLYLIWSLFPSNRFDFRDSDEDFEDSDDDYDASPKKMGYVTIPATDAVKLPPAKAVV